MTEHSKHRTIMAVVGLTVIIIGLILLAALASVHAADAYSTKDSRVAAAPLPVAKTYDGIQSGLYFGGHVGWGIGRQNVHSSYDNGEGDGMSASLTGLAGEDMVFGIMTGYRQCIGRVCGGVVGLYDFLDAETDLTVRSSGQSARWSLGMEDMWTVGGTFGVKLGTAEQSELFGLLGYSGATWTLRGHGVADAAEIINATPGMRLLTEEDLTGWTFGVGGRHKIAAGLEAYLLYTYTDFDSFDAFRQQDGGALTRVQLDPDLHVIRAGLVYTFGVEDAPLSGFGLFTAK